MKYNSDVFIETLLNNLRSLSSDEAKLISDAVYNASVEADLYLSEEQKKEWFYQGDKNDD